MDAADHRLTLSADDREALTRLTEGVRPHSDRAKAILALSERGDVDYAAERSGLTYRQVRYWYIRFQAGGLQAMLPRSPVTTEPETVEQESDVLNDDEVIEDITEPGALSEGEVAPEPKPGRTSGRKSSKKKAKKKSKKDKKKSGKKSKKAKKKAGGSQKKSAKKSVKKPDAKSGKKQKKKAGKKPKRKPVKKSGKGAKRRKKR